MGTSVVTLAMTLLVAVTLEMSGSDASPSVMDAVYSSDSSGDYESMLSIIPPSVQAKELLSKMIFTCSLNKDLSITGSGWPELRWKGPDNKYINDSRSRKYSERLDRTRMRLYISDIEQTDAGVYTCEASLDGARYTRNNSLVIYEDIHFTETSSYVEHVTGSSPLIECAAVGRPEPEISWRFKGKKIQKHGNAKYRYEKNGLRIRNLEVSDNGTYECRAHVVNQGNLKVHRISLNVLYPPIITVPLENPVAIRGKDVTLTCRARGNPEVEYEWIKEEATSNGTYKRSIVSNADGRYVIQAVDTVDQGRYVCIASNSMGRQQAHLDLLVSVPPSVIVPHHHSILEGKNLVLPCEATGAPQASIRWNKISEDGTIVSYTEGRQPGNERVSFEVSDLGIGRLLIDGVQRRDAGRYTCVANNSAGFDSRSVNITVDFTPTIYTKPKSNLVILAWKGEKRTLTCVAFGLPTPTISWLHGPNFMSSTEAHKIVSTKENVETVMSTLEMTIDDQTFAGTFDNYSCIAKNIHGHDQKAILLKQAFAPDMPRNVTVVEESASGVSLTVSDTPPSDGLDLPITMWVAKYQKSAASDELPTTLLFEGGSNITIPGLEPDTEYTIYLSASNSAGTGDSAKFQIRTQKLPDDFRRRKTDSHHADGAMLQADQAIRNEAVALEREIILERGLMEDWGGISLGLVIGIAAMLAVLVVTVSGAIVRTHRAAAARHAVLSVVKKRRLGDSTSAGTGNGSVTTVSITDGKDIDCLKMEIRRPSTTAVESPFPGLEKYGSLQRGLSGRPSELTSPKPVGRFAPVPPPMSPSATLTRARKPVLPATTLEVIKDEKSEQSKAWKEMLKIATSSVEAGTDGNDRPISMSDLPPPPTDMLVNGQETSNGKMELGKECVQELTYEEDEHGFFNDEDDEERSNSEDDGYENVSPPFVGKSFREY